MLKHYYNILFDTTMTQDYELLPIEIPCKYKNIHEFAYTLLKFIKINPKIEY